MKGTGWHGQSDIGRLRFECGIDFTYAPLHSGLSWKCTPRDPIPRSGIPKIDITFGWPRINGHKPDAKSVRAFYPDKKPTGSPDCAWIKADGENCIVELGPIFQRDEARRHHPLDVKPITSSDTK